MEPEDRVPERSAEVASRSARETATANADAGIAPAIELRVEEGATRLNSAVTARLDDLMDDANDDASFVTRASTREQPPIADGTRSS